MAINKPYCKAHNATHKKLLNIRKKNSITGIFLFKTNRFVYIPLKFYTYYWQSIYPIREGIGRRTKP